MTRASTDNDLYRAFFCFDCSAITVKPASATINLYGYIYGSDVILVEVDQAATISKDAALVDGDFGKIQGYVDNQAMSGNVVEYSAQVAWATGYNVITLTDAALQAMADNVSMKLALIDHDYDYSRVTPGATARSGVYFVEETATSKDPYIDYVEGSSGPSGTFVSRRAMPF